MPTFGSLFAGIGGIDLGLERAGWECRWQVEWDAYCQRVLDKHWPDVPRYGDITGVDWSGVEPVDLIAGGFPCQPFSVAGRRRGTDDDRWLWPEFARAIRALRPSLVLVENVPGLLAGGGMGAVLGGLAELGYDAEWDSIPAAAVGAPHLRFRVWIVAYRAELGRAVADTHIWRSFDPLQAGRDATRNGGSDVAHADLARLERPGGDRGEVGQGSDEQPAGSGGLEDITGEGWRPERPADAGEADGGRAFGGPAGSGWWSTEPDVGRVAHGVPARMDRLRALGNAVVPQVVEVIGRKLLEMTEAQEKAA